MNIFQRLFKRKTSADKIADVRSEYFNRFVGVEVCGNDSTERAKYPSGWCGATPDEAMQLADKVVAWLYSAPPIRSTGSNSAHRGRY